MSVPLYSLVPRPRPQERKGSGDYWALSCSMWSACNNRPCDAKRKRCGALESCFGLLALISKAYRNTCGFELMRFIPTRLCMHTKACFCSWTCGVLHGAMLRTIAWHQVIFHNHGKYWFSVWKVRLSSHAQPRNRSIIIIVTKPFLLLRVESTFTSKTHPPCDISMVKNRTIPNRCTFIHVLLQTYEQH